ncbi:hypothetical protein MPRI_22930 [Mycobacterium paraintracellulare]|uniref:Transposase n=1 Tax=Mycobacterium paraintracellulare TaxID=1138383 RepID=A0ABM7K836_9MYCO|nr:hypothetical protein OCQ_04210 [Mycobacterium paraintracellulare]OSC19860.1 hypothetical protein B8W68_25220 [Mycobacterium paraintracellulare]BBY70106.1 hypothetical protein MPRI_22930 [Mycobacterium paraintracellulare]
MINKFREFAARVAVLAADESGMSTVEYSTKSNYSIDKRKLWRSTGPWQPDHPHRREAGAGS